jgi:CHASE2 domain-containing sensor protein
MRQFFKKVFSQDNFFATAFIFLMMWGLSNIKINSEIFNPVSDMFGDFEITDLVSSKIEEETPEDTNIVLVNIGNLTRAEIAAEIDVINKYEPKVIGIDAFFRKPKEDEIDMPLQAAFSNTKNLVLVSKLHYNDRTDNFDSLETSNPKFVQFAQTGHANFITEGDEMFRTARTFVPFDTVNIHQKRKEVEPAFASKIVKIFDPNAYKYLTERQNEIETIRYRGNIFGARRKFYVIDIDDVLQENFEPSLIRNKIVLMGYMGERVPETKNTWDNDKFFTPLNSKYVGKAFQDMFGVVVHANVISMILHQDYINESSELMSFIIGFLMCFFSVVLFHLVLEWTPQLFDPVTKGFQLVIIVILNFIVAYLFLVKNFKIDFGIALIAIALAPDLLEIYLHLIKRPLTFLLNKVYIRKSEETTTQ